MMEEKPSIKTIKLNGLDDVLMVDVLYFDYKQRKLLIEASSEIKIYITYDIDKLTICNKLPVDNPEKDDVGSISFDTFGSYFVNFDIEEEPEGNGGDDDSKRNYSLMINSLVPTSVGLLHMIINDGTFGFYGPYVCQEMIEMLM
jgi:hypothetical protein